MLVDDKQAAVAGVDDQCVCVPVRRPRAHDIRVLRGHRRHDTTEEPAGAREATLCH